MQMLSARDLTEALEISYCRLDYLFVSRRLNPSDFTLINGRRFYKKKDISKVKKALDGVRRKRS